jgi:hypothetical protein
MLMRFNLFRKLHAQEAGFLMNSRLSEFTHSGSSENIKVIATPIFIGTGTKSGICVTFPVDPETDPPPPTLKAHIVIANTHYLLLSV